MPPWAVSGKDCTRREPSDMTNLTNKDMDKNMSIH